MLNNAQPQNEICYSMLWKVMNNIFFNSFRKIVVFTMIFIRASGSNIFAFWTIQFTIYTSLIPSCSTTPHFFFSFLNALSSSFSVIFLFSPWTVLNSSWTFFCVSWASSIIFFAAWISSISFSAIPFSILLLPASKNFEADCRSCSALASLGFRFSDSLFNCSRFLTSPSCFFFCLWTSAADAACFFFASFLSISTCSEKALWAPFIEDNIFFVISTFDKPSILLIASSVVLRPFSVTRERFVLSFSQCLLICWQASLIISISMWKSQSTLDNFGQHTELLTSMWGSHLKNFAPEMVNSNSLSTFVLEPLIWNFSFSIHSPFICQYSQLFWFDTRQFFSNSPDFLDWSSLFFLTWMQTLHCCN